MSFFIPAENRLGVHSFYSVDTATAYPFGTIVRGQDVTSSYGFGEFIYLPGVASTKVGSLVIYNILAQTTTLSPNTAHLAEPVAVAMAAVTTAGNFGWYQIEGVAVVRKTAVKVSPNVQIFLTSTAGSIAPTVASGKQIVNAITVNAATVTSGTSTVAVQIQRPFAQGQVV